MLKSLRILAIVLFALGFAQFQATRATAQTVDFYTHYDVTLNSNATDVTNILFLEAQNSLSWAWSTNCGGTGNCSTQMDNPFGNQNAPTTALLLGLTNGGNDVVLMTNTTFPASADIWSNLFPNTDFATFLGDIQLATSGGPFCSPGQTTGCIDPGLNAIVNFGGGDGSSAYFAINAGSFNVWDFSNGSDQGVQIGTGTSSVTSNEVNVPEGGAFLLYLLLAAASCFAAFYINSRKRLTTDASA